jgi:hypothetical protein
MILCIFLLISLYFTWLLCADIQPIWLGILCAPIFYALFGMMSIGAAAFLSLLLGRSDKEVLLKKERYWIRNRKNDIYYIYSLDEDPLSVHTSYITETRTDTKTLLPYFEIEYYGLGGWRKFLLLDLYTHPRRIILYNPIKDET